MKFSNIDSTRVLQTIDPATVSADTNSEHVDLSGFDTAQFVYGIGQSNDFSSTNFFTLRLQHSHTNTSADFVNVPSGEIHGPNTTGSDGVVAVVDSTSEDDHAYRACYLGTRRYVRQVIDESGSLSVPCSGHAVLSRPTSAPAN